MSRLQHFGNRGVRQVYVLRCVPLTWIKFVVVQVQFPQEMVMSLCIEL
jgi:hypothetical protein